MRIGWGATFVSARTQDARLGDLGEDTLSAHRLEIGSLVGLAAPLTECLYVEAEWRHTALGAPSNPCLFGSPLGLPEEPSVACAGATARGRPSSSARRNHIRDHPLE